MKEKSYKTQGKILLFFSIICSIGIIFLSFSGNGFLINLTNSTFLNSIFACITFILCIFSGIQLKTKAPFYYKYQILSGVILLSTILIFDIIPRIIYSIY